jgi:UDP-N-acetylmuramoylalanine--D-glutamate ligase
MSGGFNLENIAAAAALAKRAGAPDTAIFSAAKSFKGLEHRLEFVLEKNGLAFYNDSYATRPEATCGALHSFHDRPIGLILGGSEKFADFSPLVSQIAVQPNIAAIALIGDTATRLEKSLKEGVPSGKISIRICYDLPSSLSFLTEIVSSGVVLLSPACASFGLFDNYKDRGNKFKALVEKYYN